MKKPMYPQGSTVTPKQFGAMADGKTDDIKALRAAIAHASEKQLPLELEGGAEYYISEPLVLDHVTILAQNARISYWGEHFNRPALDIRDYVVVFGTLNIWMVAYCPPGTLGGRCNLGLGNYDTGVGAHHCYFEHVNMIGNFLGSDGCLLTGDSFDIHLDRVTVPTGEPINVPIMIHWGNYDDHNPVCEGKDDLGYNHKDGWKYSTHPHDIHIGTIEGGIHAPLYIAASYDIEVDELIAHNAKFGLCVTGADMAYEYACPEEKAHGGRNIHIKKVTATNLSRCALYFNTYAHYIPNTKSQADITVDEVNATATAESSNGIAMYGAKSIKIGRANLSGFAKSALQLGYGNENVRIDELTIENSKTEAVCTCEKAKWDVTDRVEIGSLTVKNSGTVAYPMFELKAINSLTVDSLTVESSPYNALLRTRSDCRCVNIKAFNGLKETQLSVGTDKK